jgi:hypothetical protein
MKAAVGGKEQRLFQPTGHCGAGKPLPGVELSDIEIKEHKPPVLFQNNVGGLHISMGDSMLVQIVQDVENFAACDNPGLSQA